MGEPFYLSLHEFFSEPPTDYMELPDKITRRVREKWDELDNVLIPGPLKEPEELLQLMRRHRFAEGLRLDRDLDLNYLPRRINLARLNYLISPPGRDTYHIYPNDLRKVDGPWHQPLPFRLPNLVILDICFKEATYWLPSILRAVTLALKRIILRDGDDIIDSVRVFDFPITELNEFLYQHPETRLILPFVSFDERAIWIGELFFVFQRGHARFLLRNGES
jgi:hypothetical protein